MKHKKLIVDESDIRLDKYLANKIDDISRSQFQKYIKNGDITVNGLTQTARHQLSIGDKIIINISKDIVIADFVEPQNISLNILYEDDDIIIVNKPAGMTVHPGTGNPTDTLANALAYHCKQLSDINGPIRPGIIHRLDKDTSGVIVAAKTNYAHSKLAEQFADRLVKKMYFGITWGSWKKKEGLIDHPIARKRSDPTSYIVNSEGKKSRTKYKIIKETNYFSLINYFPETGRTHQIRVHSTYLGNPIIGDIKYGGGLQRGKGFLPEITKKMGSIFSLVSHHILHAQKLIFIHPTIKEEMVFEAPIPNDIQKIISKIEILNV